MESKRSLGAKSLRAAGRKPVKNQQNLETRMLRDDVSQPPDRNFANKRTLVRRFQQNAAVTNQGFSLANGHDQFLTVTSALGAAVPYVDSWRIKKIDVWAWASGDIPTSVNISPVGTDLTSNMNNDPEASYFMTARSATIAKHMCIVPSKFRPLGQWHFTSNVNFAGVLFQMSIGSASATLRLVIMDITFEVVNNEIGLPLGYGVTTATTTLGTLGARNILSGMAVQGVNNLG